MLFAALHESVGTQATDEVSSGDLCLSR